jgi:copper transport protein
VLAAAPEQIVLDFDEPIEESGASVDVFDASGAPVRIADPVLSATDGSILSTDVPELTDGTFAVVWRIVSSDGHVIDGAFSFQVGIAAAADGRDLLDRVAGDRTDAGVSRTYGVARAIGYLGVALLLGGGLLLLLSPGDHRGRAVRLVHAGGVVAVGATAVGFGSYAATISGGGLPDALDPEDWSTAADTRTGGMLLLRLVALAILVALVAAWRASHTRWWRAAAAVASVVAVATFPASGHAGAVSPSALWVAIGVVHTGCGLIWIGGLVMLVARAVTTAHRFSLVSSVAIPLVVATGVVQTLELVDDLDDLTATTWGRVLLVKIAVVAVALAVAGVSRWLVVHAAGTSLRRTVAVEAVLGLGVIGLAAGLVALPPTAAAESAIFDATLAEAGLIADVTLTPGRVGANELHVVVTPPGASIRPVENLAARMLLPSRGIPASPVTVAPDGADHYTGAIILPFAGEWTLELVVEVTPGNTVLLKTIVPIP